MSDKNSLGNRAAWAGLILGAVSIAYFVGSSLTAGLGSPIIANILNMLLWLAKFSASIYLLRKFMIDFFRGNPSSDRSRVFRFGMLTAFLSALVYSSFYLAYVTFIAPDIFDEAFELLAQMPMAGNTLSEMEEMLPMMPTYGFFGNLIYCFIFGTVLSAVFARGIVDNDPFKDNNELR